MSFLHRFGRIEVKEGKGKSALGNWKVKRVGGRLPKIERKSPFLKPTKPPYVSEFYAPIAHIFLFEWLPIRRQRQMTTGSCQTRSYIFDIQAPGTKDNPTQKYSTRILSRNYIGNVFAVSPQKILVNFEIAPRLPEMVRVGIA